MGKTCKFVRSMVALLLVVAMIPSCGVLASAAGCDSEVVATIRSEIPAWSKGGENVEVVGSITEEIVAPVFNSIGWGYYEPPVSKVSFSSNYWVQASEPYYSSLYCSNVAEFRLSNAAKICRLMSSLYPVNQIRYEYSNLKKHNNLQYLKRIVYSGQPKSIWSYLSVTTRSKITKMDAERALKYVQKTAEYRNNATLRQYVDWYLYGTLSGDQLRWGLKNLYPQSSDAIDRLNVANLLHFAKCVYSTSQFQRLERAMEPLYHRAGHVNDLTGWATESQITMYYDELANAVCYYRLDLPDSLASIFIVLPVADDSGVGTSGDGSIPSRAMPDPIVKTPKAYGH